MKTIGITGQDGFIGTHLFNRISLLKNEFEIVPYYRSMFNDPSELERWVSKCDVIIHLAALNRHPDLDVIYETNINLVERLVSALKVTPKKPHIIFSSSSQEERDNLYGKSKQVGRLLLKDWAKEHFCLTGMIIPNVFGPFGKPHYNSVVATFCHKLCNNAIPVIDVDATIKLIYIDELVNDFIYCIINEVNNYERKIMHTKEISVSNLLEKLQEFNNIYIQKGIMPVLADSFEVNLFNTLRSYIDYSSYYPIKLKKNEDARGVFMEVIKLQQGGQVSFSTTHPGITRGNHFHTRKIERFAVIKGKALIQLRRFNTTDKFEFILDGQEPSFVDMPIWCTHNIKNIGADELYTIFWINEFYNEADPDTFFELV